MNEHSEPLDPRRTYVPICAIGASAGGIPALQNLFRQVPPDLGLAYVVVLHLSPDQPSALDEILAGCTRMSVVQVTDSQTLKADCVFVIAPDKELVIKGDSVSAQDFSQPRGQRAAIDLFFRSIASARGDGVAIVLSGAGADGAMGARAVKEGGGVVMVQEPAEADFPSMPQNAIATGAADFVAPVARLAEYLREVALSKEAVRSLDAHAANNELRRIVSFLRARTGHDFASYKRATVLRRVMRRMQVRRMTTLLAYAQYLQSTPEEIKELFSDLLISVTQFFRDARSFDVLQQRVIGPILEDADPQEGLRAWVVGCASGEEAYSIAILMLEEAERRKLALPIQIFATDLDEGALATAREGRYSKAIQADVSEGRLARFFTDEGTHYRVRKEVRETVLFALHSVLKEPPFRRLDLVSCRNLLIYLERSLQQQLCALFHYGLKQGRFLFLGSAETADTPANLFVTLDREARIYSAQHRASEPLPVLPQFPSPERMRIPRSLPPAERAPSPGALHLAALEHTAPPSILVDNTQNILHLSPSAGRYLMHSAGPLLQLLPAVARNELRLDLKLALNRALEQRLATLTHPATVALDGERRRVAMHILPVVTDEPGANQAIVYFLDAGVAAEDDPDAPRVRPEEVRHLHAELKAAQEALVASRSGHDLTIQELRAANEELQSTNEEYRSTAEELETSREELQSINEELHTVNAEMKSKLETLSMAHNDLQNLNAATEIGTLFLDGDLRIKMFSPPIAQLFNISAQDIGRPITNFTHRLEYQALPDDARRVLHDLVPLEREVHSSADAWFVMRLRPYRTVENRIEGVVVTFIDITMRLKAEAALTRSEAQLRALVRASSQVLYRMSPDWDEMRELFGGGFLSNTDSPAESWLKHYIPAEDQEMVRSVIEQAVASRSIFDLEHRILRADGSIGWTHSRAIPLLDADGGVSEWFGSASDVTLRRRAEEALRESEERLRVLIEGVPQHVWRAVDGGHWTWSSPQWSHYTGLSAAESRDYGWLAAVHPGDRDRVMTAWHQAPSLSLFEVQCRVRRVGQKEYRWFRGRATPFLDERGRIVEWLGTFTDVDDLRELQERQQILLAELQHRVRNLLAVIRAIAARTADSSQTVEEFATAFEGRLNSLARTQILLTGDVHEGIDLKSMVIEELLAQADASTQIDIAGPPVSLSPKALEVFSLAIHELTTNAIKYGALSTAAGRIEIRWQRSLRDADEWLTFSWIEHSATRYDPDIPRRRGFGTELIEQRVPYELRGRGQVELTHGGLQSRIEFPLRLGDSILQTGISEDSAAAPRQP